MAEPRLYALPPGCDYARELLAGLETWLGDAAPEARARVTILVNTRRMQRRLHALLVASGPVLMPRIRLITDLAADPTLSDLPLPGSALRRRLELAGAVAQLIDRQPELAPRGAVFDLADSLARLMDEMQGEDVGPDTLTQLDVSEHSAHWARSLTFVEAIARYWAPGMAPGVEARQRAAVAGLVARWARTPPADPVIVAGSTGSRGTTRVLIEAVARLANGAVVLPGFDFDMPPAVWQALDDAGTAEDHPQYRFHRLMDALGIAPGAVRRWTPAEPAAPGRNRLLSLALRPAPVTDQWLAEGPELLPDLGRATRGVTLLEAPEPRAEALAIALSLRRAAEDGITAALITPDRVLTRRVAAALDRWGIVPDDSAGAPLALSPPGRFLRQVAELFGALPTGEALVALLGHPLCHSGDGRGEHLRLARDLELGLLRGGAPFVEPARLLDWAGKRGASHARWAQWLAPLLADAAEAPDARPLTDHLAGHVALAEALAAGSQAAGSGTLWDKAAGEEARAALAELTAEADAGGEMTAAEYRALLRSVLDTREVRETLTAHPRILIWGTLEARVQGADLVILAGLNEGVWPEAPAPDPWLSRPMRLAAGLLLPERRIGLAAHDFQQAAAAPEVMLSRALRDDEAPTVPARWLNRLVNLLQGLGPEGTAALGAMRAAGAGRLDLARRLETPATPVAPAPRPSPRPPVAARPRKLSVTRIRTLIRDPYAIYAREILRLRPLDPLRPEPDPPLRGTAIHAILARFLDETRDGLPEDARARLLAIAESELAANVRWPAARRLWAAQIARAAEWFLATEAGRRAEAQPLALECRGRLDLADPRFTIIGTADRIDRRPDGELIVYDYKTGQIPSSRQVRHFDRQLPIEGLMAEGGGFEGLDAAPVAGLRYIGLGTKREQAERLEDGLLEETRAGLVRLLRAWDARATGYASRARLERRKDAGEYDHLARLGEWDEADMPQPEDVG